MAPNLQGLNIVHPAHHPADNHDLLAGPAFPDLSAQLDLWTNLAFEDDGPLSAKPDDYRRKARPDDDDDDDAAALSSHGTSSGDAAIHDGHINVVAAPEHHPSFDLNAFLAGFGVDPYAVPQPQPPSLTPSLAQLIALHATPSFSQQPQLPSPSSSTASAPPPAKRSRTRKASTSTPPPAPESPEREETPAPTSPISAAEDKRRRNTAASARFRLKKKEREAALEGKAKELEARVNELERECEGLRRENGWLKGLVVGVTGAAQAPAAPVAAGSKRGRDHE